MAQLVKIKNKKEKKTHKHHIPPLKVTHPIKRYCTKSFTVATKTERKSDLCYTPVSKKNKNRHELPARKIIILINASEGRTDTATFFSMYIAHTDCRRTQCARPKKAAASQRAPEATLVSPFQGEMLVVVAFSPAQFRPDSHLLQRVAHFNPLSLYCRFSRPSGRISITAQVTHLIREGCIFFHE